MSEDEGRTELEVKIASVNSFLFLYNNILRFLMECVVQGGGTGLGGTYKMS